MRILFYALIIAQFVSCNNVTAQNYAVYNSYYINPYLYNPAEAASEYTYVFVNHRQQWMDIEGAPVLTTVNFNTLLDNSHSGVGVKLSSFKRGLLSTNDVSLTYAYGIGLSEKSRLFFALSGGAITNNINLDLADPSDPAVTNYLADNIQPAGNFGMMFKSESGFNFGFALPQLFSPKFNSTASFENTAVSPLDNIIVSAYYRKKLSGKMINRKRKGVNRKVKTDESYAPIEVYVLYKYAKAGNSQAEAMLKLNLSQNLWLGAAYRQSYGMSGSLGLAISKFLLSYSYEPGNQPEPAFSQGTHEIQLGLKLGSVKSFRKKSPVLLSRLRQQAAQHSSRFKQEVPPLNNAVQLSTVAKTKHYVVVKVFTDFTSADKYKKELRDEKFNANLFYYEKDRKYYVHILETEKSADAHQEVRNLKTYTKLNTARVLTIEPKK
ncbi:MAG: PorP/SprF family type IX secretion system membrane protein [Cyclobacteriaceae bacterium]